MSDKVMSPTEALQVIGRDFTDEYGTIVMADRDGGDSLHKFSLTMSAIKMLDLHNDYLGRPFKEGYATTMAQYEVAPGQLVRHPKAPWNNPTDSSMPTTRDQVDPAFQLMDLIGDKERAVRVANDFIARGYRFPSGDIASPEHIKHMLDATEQGTIYSDLFGDLFLLGDSLIRVALSAYDSDATSDDIPHIFNLVKARKYHPGFLNGLAKWVYKFRFNAGPKNGPRLEGFGPSTAMLHYFRPDTGSPPIAELWLPLIEEYLR